MVRNQLRGVSLNSITTLASEEVTNQNRPAQLLPSRSLVPLAPWLGCITLSGSRPLAIGRVANAWR